MKIYLACTVRGDRAAVIALRNACALLQSRGHDVLTSHLLRDDVESVEAALAERDVYERDIQWLDSCDALVADASGSSFGVGFEVGYVLARAPQTGQRVYLLYDAARAGRVSRMITGNSDAHCSKYAYTSPDDLLAFIDAHFE
ncbi:MAG: nucleoside 2-deoxyribosyltransferase [Acidobacteria bacterium]|nr:nucleoside 2-deoxyribosyltransferase [Acidobacteriota bacterium]